MTSAYASTRVFARQHICTKTAIHLIHTGNLVRSFMSQLAVNTRLGRSIGLATSAHQDPAQRLLHKTKCLPTLVLDASHTMQVRHGCPTVQT